VSSTHAEPRRANIRRADPRALWRYGLLRDLGLPDLYLVLQACRLRRGLQGTAKQERAYLGLRRCIEDPDTSSLPKRKDYTNWRNADPERRERYPAATYIIAAFGNTWDDALEAVTGARREILLRRKTARGRSLSQVALCAWFDAWLRTLDSEQHLKRDDFEVFLEGYQRDAHPELGIAPGWFQYRREFGSWDAFLLDRRVHHRAASPRRRVRTADGAMVAIIPHVLQAAGTPDAASDAYRAPSKAPDEDALEEWKEVLVAAAGELGPHLSYPQYNRWRDRNFDAYQDATGKPLPHSRTLMRHLGGGSWPQAKVAAGLISQRDADSGRTRLKRGDDELLDIVCIAIEQKCRTRAHYVRWRPRYRRDQTSASGDPWTPDVDTLLARFGGPDKRWKLVMAAAEAYGQIR
jgi:hypothetical protein